MSNIHIPQNDIIIPRGKVMSILRNIHTGKEDIQMVDNMVVTVAKNAIADRLIGTTSNNKGIVTYCALGTGIVAPVAGNTGLGTELFRKLVSVREVSGNVATFSTFFTATEVTGTLTEAGLFGDDANALSGSGTLYARTLISRVKTVNDTLTLVWAVTIG
jgi:hypothetical protein